jgi:hypothetical protein
VPRCQGKRAQNSFYNIGPTGFTYTYYVS